MASGLGSGAVDSLGYGRKLVQLTIPFATMALSTVHFPRLAQLAAAGDLAALRSTVRTCMRGVMVVALPMTIILFVASRPVVQLLGLAASVVFVVSFAQVQFVAWLELNRRSPRVRHE